MKKIVLFATGLCLAVSINAQTFYVPEADEKTPGLNKSTTGNVGIGISSPGAKLDVYGELAVGSGSVNANTTKIFLRNPAGGKTWAISSGANMVTEASFSIYNWTDNQSQPYFHISSSGNVGIGTPSPTSLLTIRNSALSDDSNNGSVDLTFATTLSGFGNKISSFKETFNTAGMAFYTQYGYAAPFERMRISAIGKIGIGCLSPETKLDVREAYSLNDLNSNKIRDILAMRVSVTDNFVPVNAEARMLFTAQQWDEGAKFNYAAIGGAKINDDNDGRLVFYTSQGTTGTGVWN